MKHIKIGFGGSCHWCTEAVFQSLKGVFKVEQGWVASTGENRSFSEGVIVHFDSNIIGVSDLIEIHLHTHNSSSDHAMRKKYRSAVYTFSEIQEKEVNDILASFQHPFSNKLITKVIAFKSFKPSREAIQNYYQKNPKKPFCERYINPKLKLLLDKFSKFVNNTKLSHIEA